MDILGYSNEPGMCWYMFQKALPETDFPCSQVVLNDFYEWKFQPLLVPPPTLQEDMRRLVNNRELSDVTFIVDGFPVYARWLFLPALPISRFVFCF